MKNTRELEQIIKIKQEKVNKYIENKGFSQYDELLELSRELDVLITLWLKSNLVLDKI